MHPFRVALARAYQRLGTAGALGIALLALALVLAVPARQLQRDNTALAADVESALQLPIATPQVTPAPSPWRLLPPTSDVPLLLTRLQRTAVEHGLGWSKADYRLQPASAGRPAALQVDFALNGPYLAVRGFITALLQDAPSLTFTSFSVRRANAQTPDVEAKLSLVIYLSDEPADARQGGAR